MGIPKIVAFICLVNVLFFNEYGIGDNKKNSSEHKYKELSTRAEYDALIADKEKPVVIKLYAEWCGPCQAYGTAFSAFAEHNKDEIGTAAIDIDNKDFMSLMKKEQVASIPTTWFIKDGEILEKKKGQLTEKELTNTVQKLFGASQRKETILPQPKVEKQQPKAQPKQVIKEEKEEEHTSGSIKELSTMREYESLLAGSKPVVVKFYAEWCDTCSELKPLYKQLAAQYGDEVIFVVINAENAVFKQLAARYVQSYPTLLFITKGKVKDIIAGDLSKKILEGYINSLLGRGGMVKVEESVEEEMDQEEEAPIEQPQRRYQQRPSRESYKRDQYHYQEDDFE